MKICREAAKKHGKISVPWIQFKFKVSFKQACLMCKKLGFGER